MKVMMTDEEISSFNETMLKVDAFDLALVDQWHLQCSSQISTV